MGLYIKHHHFGKFGLRILESSDSRDLSHVNYPSMLCKITWLTEEETRTTVNGFKSSDSSFWSSSFSVSLVSVVPFRRPFWRISSILDLRRRPLLVCPDLLPFATLRGDSGSPPPRRNIFVAVVVSVKHKRRSNKAISVR